MTDAAYMHRCLELARMGAGAVAPNPMVGAVLVHRGRIIGEGYHRRWGGPHAEVVCLGSVAEADRGHLPESTLYCNLEPCAHTGKTPPCVQLVLDCRIKRVVIGQEDPNPLVSGRGIQKLRDAGILVEVGCQEEACRRLNAVFNHFITTGRPYVVLKWAQSKDGFIGQPDKRVPISGAYAARLVHRWRGSFQSILVGTRTALTDNPRLDIRLGAGVLPLRIALDYRGALSSAAHLLDDSQPTWIIGKSRPGNWKQTEFVELPSGLGLWEALLKKLAGSPISSLMVEGGSAVLHQCIELGLYNEIRVLESSVLLGQGVRAPRIPAGSYACDSFNLEGDVISLFYFH
jgi:diaminohydroxyphosphoribosylaminopyrimidine deaminase/5-amino-6-(5-phosphoribosylamino)uracil reductase